MSDLLHDEIVTVEHVRALWIERYFNPTPANIQAHRNAALACRCPPMTAVYPEAVVSREQWD